MLYGVPFGLGSFNNLCVVLALSNKKQIQGAKRKKTVLLVSLNIAIFKYQCGAVTLAINFILCFGTKLVKRHQLLIALLRDLKCFDDVELVVKFQVGSTFNMFTEN